MFSHHAADRMTLVDRGRYLVCAVVVITVMGNLFFVVIPAASDSAPSFVGTILGFCAVAALLYAMWCGRPWARWLLIGIYVVGLAFRVTLIFRSPQILDIARASQQLVAFLLLATPPSVLAFLAAQRNARDDI
jgi:hypothetical protein